MYRGFIPKRYFPATFAASVSTVICALALTSPAIHAGEARKSGPVDLCASMIKEIQSLVREVRTDCAVQSRTNGADLIFNTEYRAFADSAQARAYLLYVFGSAGHMLNRNQLIPVSTVTLTDDALKRQGMKFSIDATELKRLQRAASTGEISMNKFHTELMRTGKFDRHSGW